MFQTVKAWLYAIGAALVGGLAAWGMYNKKKAERLEIKAETLEATVHADRVIKKIKKKKKEELLLKEERIKESVKNREEDPNLDNLFNNDGWD